MINVGIVLQGRTTWKDLKKKKFTSGTRDRRGEFCIISQPLTGDFCNKEESGFLINLVSKVKRTFFLAGADCQTFGGF